jgi:class 3 adenylate cyclase
MARSEPSWASSSTATQRGGAPSQPGQAIGLPSGTVTFLFTDLEVSTRLRDQEPDAMQDALVRHDAILRDAVGTYGGVVVKGRGDGVHAVYIPVPRRGGGS